MARPVRLWAGSAGPARRGTVEPGERAEAAMADEVATIGYDRLAAHLAADTATVGDLLRRTGLAQPVPTCPGWTMADLAAHVGRGHRWATLIVGSGATGPVPIDRAPVPDAGLDATGLAGWLADGAAGLVAAVRAAGPGTAVWTWSTDRTVGFWLRRMVHDLLIHRVDAELAAGRVPVVAPDLAADGVADLLSSIAVLSAQPESGVFTALRGPRRTLAFQATDHDPGTGPAGPGGWWVECGPDGVTWRYRAAAGPVDDTGAPDVGVGPAGVPDVTLRAPAGDLLLILNRRLPVGGTGGEVTGDRTVLQWWLDGSVF